MHENVRNNVFFESAIKFKICIKQFFDDELPKLLSNLRSTINDKFHITNFKYQLATEPIYAIITQSISFK